VSVHFERVIPSTFTICTGAPMLDRPSMPCCCINEQTCVIQIHV